MLLAPASYETLNWGQRFLFCRQILSCTSNVTRRQRCKTDYAMCTWSDGNWKKGLRWDFSSHFARGSQHSNMIWTSIPKYKEICDIHCSSELAGHLNINPSRGDHVEMTNTWCVSASSSFGLIWGEILEWGPSVAKTVRPTNRMRSAECDLSYVATAMTTSF